MAYTIIYDSSSEGSVANLTGRVQSLEANKANKIPAVFAQVELNASVIINAGDTFAQSGWSATTNIGNAFKASTVAGTGTGYSRFIIPTTGRYSFDWRMICNSGAGATRTAVKVLKNGRNIGTQSIATDSALKNGEGDDFHMFVHINQRFVAGDVIYFATYAAGGQYALVKASFGGAKTIMELTYLGDY